MRYLKISQGALLNLVLAVLLISVPTRAQTQPDGEYARKLLEEATAYQTTPGSYRKVTVEEPKWAMGIIRHNCEYLMIKPDGTMLSRSESTFRGEYSASTSIQIHNEEGDWALRANNIAILASFEGLGFELPDKATLARRKEEMYRSLELEPATEKGVAYIKITSKLSDEAIADIRAQSEKVMDQSGGGVALSVMKLARKMARDKTPARVEHWLDATDHHLALIRYYTKKGHLVHEEIINGGNEKIPDLPADMFIVPAEYERISAARLKDYMDLLKKYPAVSVKVKPKEKPEQKKGKQPSP